MEIHVREAVFLERRGVVLRASVLLFGGAGLAIALLALAKRVDEAAFETLGPLLVLAGLAGGLAVWRVVRRHWRCPECAGAWPFAETLASAHWQHCPACGAALRLGAGVAQPAAALEPGLGARFRRRRRRAGALVAGIAVATLAALWVADARGLADLWLDIVAATGAGLALGVGVVAQRCPACRRGLIAGRSGHCWQCGAFVG